MSTARQIVEEVFRKADIEINGTRPWDMMVHNDDVYDRILKELEMGLGESYMEGWWDCQALDQFFFRLLRSKANSYAKKLLLQKREYFFYALRSMAKHVQIRLYNYQNKRRAFQVGESHYDVGNDLFEAMLDKELNYTCAYWKHADNLDDAQIAKLKLVCDKLKLKPGQRILDVGCGWGALARYAVKNYQVSVVGVTISKEQKLLAEEGNKDLPIEIRLMDYRDVNEPFDHIVSLGMFEHVGYKNYRTYMQVVHQCLKPEGLFLLHTIGASSTSYASNAWINKYIFPNGMIPSIKQIGTAAEKLFVMEDWHNFGAYYDNTLMAWEHNFTEHWPELKHHYSDTFYRMWRYYLLSCAGAFRARYLDLWQVVFSKGGLLNGYESIR